MFNLVLALLAGVVTIAAPCTLPVLPILLGASVGHTGKTRPAMIALGFVFLAAALHSARGAVARAYSVLGVLVALTGAGISAWHVRLQHLPPDQVPSCGPGFDYMYETFPLRDMLAMIFHGSGECAEINWTFLGFSMPTWVLAWFVALGALIVAANWRKLAR